MNQVARIPYDALQSALGAQLKRGDLLRGSYQFAALSPSCAAFDDRLRMTSDGGWRTAFYLCWPVDA